jgi:transcriptional regulator with XRE-family HTH domain
LVSISQIRAARALLNRSQQEVAEICGIKKGTLSEIENEHSPGKATTLRALQLYFENRGLEFLDGDGVRRNQTGLRHYSGAMGFREFYDDIYEAARTVGGDLCLFNGVSELVLKWLGEDHRARQVERMSKIKDHYRYRVIVEHGDATAFGSDYCQYRWFPPDLFNDKTIFIYGSKVAFVNFDNDDVQVLVIDQQEISDTQRLFFNHVWDHIAKEPEQ